MNKKSVKYSAGILPYSFYNGVTYFLVGKDAREDGWSDFGGKCEVIDESKAIMTACREFYEETNIPEQDYNIVNIEPLEYSPLILLRPNVKYSKVMPHFPRDLGILEMLLCPKLRFCNGNSPNVFGKIDKELEQRSKV